MPEAPDWDSMCAEVDRSGILVAQLALTVPLVLSCLVAYRQVQTLGNIDFGFPTERLLVAQVDRPGYRFERGADRSEFYRAVVEELRGTPGVTTAAAAIHAGR